ncbi:hypothetical protein ACFL3R_00625 [Thermodesulfobacteriota bacterium]
MLYKKFKEIDGEMTGSWFGVDFTILFNELSALFPDYEGNRDWSLSGSEIEVRINRLDDKQWTPEEIKQIDALIAEHGSQEQCDYREKLKAWKEEIAETDKLMSRQVEDVWDVIGIDKADAFAKEVHAKRKKIRARKP